MCSASHAFPRLLLAAVFAALLSAVAPASISAQTTPEQPPETAAPEETTTSEQAVVAPLPSLEDIDEILEGEEAVLSGGGYTYDPGGRRDPFKSLKIAATEAKFKGPRPLGIPGLMIDEVVLDGIYRTRNGYIAQVHSSDKKSYLLKVSDQLLDGDVVAIDARRIVFKQNVQDPTALKPFREVVKSLNP